MTLRVAVIGTLWGDSLVEGIVDTLTSMGHKACAVGPASTTLPTEIGRRLSNLTARVLPTAGERAQQPVVSRVRDLRPDLIVNVDAELMPASLSKMKQGGAKAAFWMSDAMVNLGRQLIFLGPYDAVFLKEPAVASRLQRIYDLPVHCLLEACHPGWHRIPSSEPEPAPCLVVPGGMYAYRLRLLERLDAANIPLRLYGPAWARWLPQDLRRLHTGAYLRYEQKAAVFRGAAAVLNTLHPGEITGLNCRLFEAAGCGALVLTERRDQLSDLFDVGSEVLAFDSFDEVVDQARWALAHPDEGRAMGDRASSRAHRDHCYEVRLRELLDITLGSPAPAPPSSWRW
jgi:spore maturation protein CgeB